MSQQPKQILQAGPFSFVSSVQLQKYNSLLQEVRRRCGCTADGRQTLCGDKQEGSPAVD